MILLFVSSIVTIVSVVGYWVFKCLAKRYSSKYDKFSDASGKFNTVGIVGCCATLIILLMVGFTTAAGVVQLPVKEQQYEILTYQLNNGLYDNDNDIGKRELYEEIEEYNTEVAAGKKLQENPWLNIFEVRIYDQLELIELPVVENIE